MVFPNPGHRDPDRETTPKRSRPAQRWGRLRPGSAALGSWGQVYERFGLVIFEDRLEVTSPGRLPNSATIEAIKAGLRYARNQTLVNILRDYRYVDARGMGIRNKVIPGMRKHNGTEPDFIATGHSFTVRLWRKN